MHRATSRGNMPRSNRRVAKRINCRGNFFRSGLTVESGGSHDQRDGDGCQGQCKQMKFLLRRREHLRKTVIKHGYQVENRTRPVCPVKPCGTHLVKAPRLLIMEALPSFRWLGDQQSFEEISILSSSYPLSALAFASAGMPENASIALMKHLS